MVQDRDEMIQDEFRGARLRVYGTNREDPEEGRIFIWTKTGWFERLEGTSGNVAFTPIANSEDELKDLIAEDDPDYEFIEVGGEFRRVVTEEFREDASFMEDASGDLMEKPIDEEDDQLYHQHDL
jgi:hypothetical protein